VCDQGVQHFVRISAYRSDCDAGIFPEECGNEIWQKVLSDGLRGPECQLSSMIASGAGHNLIRLVRDCLQLARVGQEALARGSECDASTTAIEQGHSELIFESLDLLCDGRLRQKQFFGSATEIEVSRDRSEDFESKIFHLHFISIWQCLDSPEIAKRPASMIVAEFSNRSPLLLNVLLAAATISNSNPV